MASLSNLDSAVQDFHQARRQAAMQEIVAKLTGESIDLFSFEEVRQKLKLLGGSRKGLQEIPLDAIVGSVGRYHDFTRSFLPRQDRDAYRWAGVSAAMTDPAGLPPIEVYQIGEAYFVLDGNHRVSVARQLGATHIEAHVTEFRTKVPLSPDDQPDDLIIKAEYADFLEKTKLDELRAEANLQVTTPGRYWELETQIEAQRFLLNQDQEREIPYAEAVTHWYEHIYLPVVQLIREQGVLRDFPNRTETDLYLWILRHQSELQKKLGWQLDPAAVAADLVADHSSRPDRLIGRVEEKLRDVLIPHELEAGPAPGQWRQERLAVRPHDRLFVNILVAVTGQTEGWSAVDQALVVARREQGRLYGLHVVSSADQTNSEVTQAVSAEFARRCQKADIPAELSIETGTIAHKICDRARWVDLVVMHLAHPPGEAVLTRLSSGARTMIARCPRPILMVPQAASPLDRVLLAYDGSPKAQEGLYVATCLAGRWQIPLVVATVHEKDQEKDILVQAREYLDAHQVPAEFVSANGDVAGTILETAAKHQSELIIMGGYGAQPVLEVVLGSSVDQVLRESSQPVLICR